MTIKWEDPPVNARGRKPRSEGEKIADQLRKRPGQWARIYEDTMTATAQSIRRGQNGFSPAGAFEAVQRVNPRLEIKSHVAVYARYVGAQDEEAAE